MSLVLAAAVVVQASGDGDGCHGGLLHHCLKVKKYRFNLLFNFSRFFWLTITGEGPVHSPSIICYSL